MLLSVFGFALMLAGVRHREPMENGHWMDGKALSPTGEKRAVITLTVSIFYLSGSRDKLGGKRTWLMLLPR